MKIKYFQKILVVIFLIIISANVKITLGQSLTLPYSGSLTTTEIAFNIESQGGAIRGLSSVSTGILGVSSSTDAPGVVGTGNRYGIYGTARSTSGVGVQGVGDIGVLGLAENGLGGYAGYFQGRLFARDNVGIGIENPLYKLDVTGTVNLNSGINEGIALRCNGVEALWFNGSIFSWGFGGTVNYFAKPVCIGQGQPTNYNLAVNGTAAKTDGGSWSNLSDIRLKNLTGNYQKGLKEIIALQPVTFTYKKDNPRKLESDKEQIGFVAQEVQKVFPEAVNECSDGYLDFNMHAVNVALVNAIKELKAENELLKSKNEQIESRLTNIEKVISASAMK